MTEEQLRMLTLYLSGAGAAIQQGEPIGPSLDATTKQLMGARSKAELQSHYMRELSRILGGLPAGAKLTGDRDSLSLKIPTSALGSVSPTGEGGGGYTEEDLLSSNAVLPSQRQGGFLSPFGTSPTGVPGASLVGLTSQDVTQALGGALGVEQLRQKRLSDVREAAYKAEALGVARTKAETARLGKEFEVAKMLRSYPIEVPGIGKVNYDTWKALDPDTKRYASYVAVSKAQKPDEPVMDRDDWDRRVAEEDKRAYYDLLIEHPEYLDIEKQIAEARSVKISLGEVAARKEVAADVAAKKYFTDPEGLAKDVESYISSRATQDELFAMEPSTRPRETIKKKADYIESRIISSNGKIVSVRMEGRTRIWTVKWPDGTTSEVSYGF